MTGQSYDDDYIANLLAKDAKTAKKTYELVGIDAFGSKRYVTTLTGGAPWRSTFAPHNRLVESYKQQTEVWRAEAQHELLAQHHPPNRQSQCCPARQRSRRVECTPQRNEPREVTSPEERRYQEAEESRRTADALVERGRGCAYQAEQEIRRRQKWRRRTWQ
jgi:hypothetical protein